MTRHSMPIDTLPDDCRNRRAFPWKFAVVAIAAALLGPASHAMAATFVVTNANTDEAGSLLEAVQRAEGTSGADTIRFDTSFFATSRTIHLDRELRFSEDLVIEGPGRSQLMIVGPGANGIGIFVLDRPAGPGSATLTVQGLTLRGTLAGGVLRRQFFVRNANLVLRDVHLQGDGRVFPAASGAAIVVQNGDLTLRDCEIRDFATHHRGAAVFVLENSPVDIYRVTIENCVLRGNRVTGTSPLDGFPKDGGALFVQGDHANGPGTKVDIVASELSGNSALNGGAVSVHNTVALTILNSTLSDNTATEAGGAVYVHKSPEAALYDAPVYIESSTITANEARIGGGLAMESPATRRILLANSVIAGNTAAQSGPTEPSTQDIFKNGEIIAAHSLIGDGAGDARGLVIVEHQAALGSVLLETDPRIGPLAENGGPSRTHALLPGSPLVDAGREGAAPRDSLLDFPGNDQRGAGFARSRGGSVDIGAFESGSSGGGGGGGSGSGGSGGGGALGIAWVCATLAALLVRRRSVGGLLGLPRRT